MSDFSEKQARDAGLAITFIIILISYYKHSYQLLPVAIVLLSFCLFWPYCLRLLLTPISILFFKIIGPFLSYVFLTLCFFLIITPIGLFRRAAGVDPLQLKKWGRENSSIFKIREHTEKEQDMENPY
jgi:hypothetical protein